MDSILNTIKNMLGVDEKCTHFDTDIIVHINTALMNLQQIGIGPPEGLCISDDTTEWTALVPAEQYAAVKTYVYAKVKLVFDSSSLSSSVIDALNRTIAEYEWRLNIAAESEEV